MRNNLLQMSDRNQHSYCSWSSPETKSSSQKVNFPDDLVQKTRTCVGTALLLVADLDILLCVWIWGWFLLCCLNKSNNWMSGLPILSKLWERGTAFGAHHLPIVWEAPYTLRDKYEGPTFVFVTHFAPTIKLMTFINERGKISPRRLEGQFSARARAHTHTHTHTHTHKGSCQDDLSTSLAWWIYNRHNRLTQNTALKRTHYTCNLSQRSPAHHYQCSVPLAEITVCFMSQRVITYLSLHSLAVVTGLTCRMSSLWLRYHAHTMFTI